MGAPKKKKEELSVIHARIDRLLAEEVRKAAIAERVSVRFLVERSLRDSLIHNRKMWEDGLKSPIPFARACSEEMLRGLDRNLTWLTTQLETIAERKRRARELLGEPPEVFEGDPDADPESGP
jgi:hypothetical protein